MDFPSVPIGLISCSPVSGTLISHFSDISQLPSCLGQLFVIIIGILCISTVQLNLDQDLPELCDHVLFVDYPECP